MTITDPGSPVGGKSGRSPSLETLRRDLDRYLTLVADSEARAQARAFLDQTKNEAQDVPPRREVLNEFVRISVRAGLQVLLASAGIAHPTYNYFKPFLENAFGPWDSTPSTWQAPTAPIWRLLGFDVSFPVGVPASVLTATAEWIEYYARQGFNVLTYKTVRSCDYAPHPSPNWVFLKGLSAPLSPDKPMPQSVEGGELLWPENPNAFSMANSFGVPSFTPDFWQKDVAKAIGCMRSGQLLIVSVMGTYEASSERAIMIDDFVKVAKMAKDAGAPVIELNLSCPNTIDPRSGRIKTSLICESEVDTADIVQAVHDAIGGVPLVVKLSYMSRGQLERVVVPLLRRGLIQGVSGINTLQMTVLKPDRSPVFLGTAKDSEKNRDVAGVSGIAIRNHGLEFVRSLGKIRKATGLMFDIIGMGGVMGADDVEEYLSAGAQAVQTATAAFFNPELPRQIYEKFGGRPVPEAELQARAAVLDLLEKGPKPLQEIAAELEKSFPTERILLENAQAVLAQLEREGLVTWERQKGKSVFRIERQAEPELEHSL